MLNNQSTCCYEFNLSNLCQGSVLSKVKVQSDTISLTAYYEPPRNHVTSYLEYLDENDELVDTESDSAIAARAQACIAALLFFGADIEAQDDYGDTPLMRRILEGDFGTAEYLLSRGANLHAKDHAGLKVCEKIESPEAVHWCAQHDSRDSNLQV